MRTQVRHPHRLLAAIVAVGLSACGTMAKVKDTTVAGVNQLADYARAPFGPAVPVVEPREGDWRELPSGRERAEAYLEQRRFFAQLADFQEPELPDPTEDPATSLLLPPKN